MKHSVNSDDSPLADNDSFDAGDIRDTVMGTQSSYHTCREQPQGGGLLGRSQSQRLAGTDIRIVQQSGSKEVDRGGHSDMDFEQGRGARLIESSIISSGRSVTSHQ